MGRFFHKCHCHKCALYSLIHSPPCHLLFMTQLLISELWYIQAYFHNKMRTEQKKGTKSENYNSHHHHSWLKIFWDLVPLLTVGWLYQGQILWWLYKILYVCVKFCNNKLNGFLSCAHVYSTDVMCSKSAENQARPEDTTVSCQEVHKVQWLKF